jgi:N-acetylglucosamine-6-phosphate deacetylase
MIDPTPECVRQVHDLTASDPVLITLAPERTGALDAIRLAVSLGMRVSLGHTNASAEVLRQAVAAGATGFTHLGNACPQELDRHDNILWRALDTPGLTASLIPDGIHVSPVLFRLVHRLLDLDRIYYTADAVAAAGASPGRYTVGWHQVDVGPDQIVRQPGKSNYAGSGLRPIDGVFRAARMLERRWQQVWPFFSVQPARFMRLPAGLAVGQSADFCLVQVNPNGELVGVRTGVGGVRT